jgi:hypothetical protein
MSNYAAMIAKIDRVEPIQKADRIQVAYVLGEPVIVSKDWGVGKVGVFFAPDTQLSEEFCKANNLFRDATKNADPEKTGFFETNRKVRAQPFQGVKSCGFFAALDCLDWTGHTQEHAIGDKFEVLNGHQICKKFINERTLRAQGNNQQKQAKKNFAPNFKEHVDTDQFKYNLHQIKAGCVISIQSKKHGTSFRVSNTKVAKELPRWQQLINKVFPVFPEYEWKSVAGTRRVVLKPDESDKTGFHGSEAYRFEVLEALKPHLSRGMTMYGEIVGFVNGKPIMGVHDMTKLKDPEYTKKYGKTTTYAYGCNEGQYDFFVYRITLTTDDGLSIDLTQHQLLEFCKNRGIKHTLDLVEPFVYDGDSEKLSALVEYHTERPDVLTEDPTDPRHIAEGVIVRCDYHGLTPKFFKSKSKAFRVLEGIFKEDNVDEEDAS